MLSSVRSNPRLPKRSSRDGRAAADASTGATGDLHTVDRRRAPRTRSHKLTTIYLPHDGRPCEPVAACIIDFSTTGMGLVVARSMTPGQRFQLDVREGNVITPLLYAVTRCDPWRGGCHRIGAILLDVARAGVRRPGKTQVQRAVDRLRRAVGN